MGLLYNKDFDVTLRGELEVEPVVRFSSANINDALCLTIQQIFNRDLPTSVQKYTIPAYAQGLDIIALSQTGSGKTGAYLVPIINRLIKEEVKTLPGGGGAVQAVQPKVVVLAPTRELAIQIKGDAAALTTNTNIHADVVYGGTFRTSQASKVQRKSVDILCATPGRLHDYAVKAKAAAKKKEKEPGADVVAPVVTFAKVHTVVIDEADKMLEGDFEWINTDILKNVEGAVQIMLLSATTTQHLEATALKLMKNKTVIIEVGLIGRACSAINQIVMELPQLKKFDKLLQLLQETMAKKEKALIFVRTIRGSYELWYHLRDWGFSVGNLSSFYDQRIRNKALKDFKDGKVQFLVTTDVASRGIHIKDLPLVINYDMPHIGDMSREIRCYVHRIGRTGRMGEPGTAISFFDPKQDHVIAPQLYLQLLDRQQDMPDFMVQYARVAEMLKAGGSTRQRGPRRPKKKKALGAKVPEVKVPPTTVPPATPIVTI